MTDGAEGLAVGESGGRAAAKLLAHDEARRIAANIAKLPGLLRALDARSAKTAVRKSFGGPQRAEASQG